MIGPIVYILPAGGYSGGANSVVQEVSGFQRMGVDASIAVDAKNASTFASAYGSLPGIISSLKIYNNEQKLSQIIGTAAEVVGTVASTLPSVLKAWSLLEARKRPKFYYYIQDYEPLFVEEGSVAWENSRKSYEYPLVTRAFAKTDWICEVVKANHGLNVQRVQASVDHSVYFPMLNLPKDGAITISAMVRPSTPRRAPRRTCRVINTLSHSLGSKVKLITFGCSLEELRAEGLRLTNEVEHHGRITREQVASLLRASDLFLDLSDYQAFGRTGLESMACGAIPIITCLGGASEYLNHGQNGFMVDVRYDNQISSTINEFLARPANSRQAMRVAAIETASKYSIENACASILRVLADG